MAQRAVEAARANEDGLGVLGAPDEMLQKLMLAGQRALDRRFAASTRKKDRSYWRFWAAWCDSLGTPPLRTNEAANRGLIPHLHQREQAIALGALLAWVDSNPQFRVDSMFARLKGVARRHKAVGITFVSLQLVAMAADGLVQEHIDVHGAETLLPKSKEPFEFSEIVAMLSLPPGTRIAAIGVVVEVGENVDWQGVVVMVHFFCTSGIRKEGIALGDKEVVGPRKFTLAQLTYLFGRVVYRIPTRALILSVLRGEIPCIVYSTPVPCKNDPKGTKYGNQPIPSRYNDHRTICFAREVLKYELMRGVPQVDRDKEPLILAPISASASVASDKGAAPGRRAWRKGGLDAFFKAHAGLVVSPDRLKALSVHSWRVWLACALLAAGAPPEQIMLLLRWSSDEARKLYARMSEGAQMSQLDMACDARVDSIRSHSLLHSAAKGGGGTSASAPSELHLSRDGVSVLVAPEPGSSVCDPKFVADVAAAAEAVRVAERLVQAAHGHKGPLPPASDLPPLDDDCTMTRVSERSAALRDAAAAADKAIAAITSDDAAIYSSSDTELCDSD